MLRLRTWLALAALSATVGCQSDSCCGGRSSLFGRLCGRSRSMECCPVMEEPCCGEAMMDSGPVMSGPQSFEAMSPAPLAPPPSAPTVIPTQPMAKPMPYVPNGK